MGAGRSRGETHRYVHWVTHWAADQESNREWRDGPKNGQFRNNSSKKELCEQSDWKKTGEQELLSHTAERNDEQERIDTQTNYTKERKATVITKKLEVLPLKRVLECTRV